MAIGCAQQPGSYDDIFSPVPHHESVKAALAEIAFRNMEVSQFDIKTAFLYAKVDKLIYMRQPEGLGKGWKARYVNLTNQFMG